MGENLKELNIDAGSNFVPKIISDILTEVSLMDNFSQKLSKLDFHVNALEEELKKIDSFERELPNCMHLLKGAIEKLKEEKLQLKGKEVRPVMEQFIPLKSDSDENGRGRRSGDFSDKKNWMSSAQLWSTPVQFENKFSSKNRQSGLHLKSSYQEVDIRSEYQQQVCSFGSRGGSFVPFKKQSGGDVSKIGSCLSLKTECNNDRVQQQQQQQQEEVPRKQRRYWSPELHQRFASALHHLGGAKAATPKQIREVMKVDGLTNDEVKSHLQKYRLQIQKLSSSSAGVSSSSLTHGGSTNGGDSMEEDEDKKSKSQRGSSNKASTTGILQNNT